MELVEQQQANSTFTKQELARLEAYRAAVAAGFYTDWDGSADTTDTQVLAWLRTGSGTNNGAAEYPFTLRERQRLEQYRAAVVAGYYTEDQAPVELPATQDEPLR
jgi:hypothetical protein